MCWSAVRTIKKKQRKRLCHKEEGRGYIKGRRLWSNQEKSQHKTLYMSSVYRAFVSDEDDMRALVKRPTFLPQVVYDVIKEATEDNNDMIVGYTTKTWQERVTKRFITHNRDPQTGICTLIPTKQEDLNSDSDWENIWQNMR